jgi:hypothetical protein
MTLIKHIPGDNNGTPALVGINQHALTATLALISVIAIIWIGVTGALERKQTRIDDRTVEMLKAEIESNRTATTTALTAIDLRLASIESFLRVNSLTVRAR